MAATARPWGLFIGDDGDAVEVLAGDDMEPPIITWLGFNDSSRPVKTHKANAALIVHAVNCHDELLAACRLGLARIESDIESPNQKTPEGDALRAVIAKAVAS